MASVSAADVKALRESTGAGMMDCKKVLTEAKGDPEKALELLRERGLSKAGKRAGRATSEGAIVISVDAGRGTIIEIGCETDFVANTGDFQGLAQTIADTIAYSPGCRTIPIGIERVPSLLVSDVKMYDGCARVGDTLGTSGNLVRGDGQRLMIILTAARAVRRGHDNKGDGHFRA